MTQRPNILLLMSDQHRADMMGCAGHPVVQTPHMDSLAARGTRFSNCFCQGPLCMPARASFLTERYVRDHGVYENASEVLQEAPTFLHSLQGAGYHTSCIGKMHLWVHGGGHVTHTSQRRDQLRAYGFDEPIETVGKLASVSIRSEYTEYLERLGLYDAYRRHVGARAYRRGTPVWNSDPIAIPESAYVDRWHGHRVAQWIEEFNVDKPFFQWVGFPGPHDPWDATRDDRIRYAHTEIPLPATLESPELLPDNQEMNTFLTAFMQHGGSSGLTDDVIRAVRLAYFANISVIDQAIGTIHDALRRKGLLDNTWIIYTGDHGEMMGEHRMLMKMVFYDPSVKVPLIVVPPEGSVSRHSRALVEHIDLVHTLLEIAGAGPVPGGEGHSILPGLSHETSGRTLIHSENYGFAMFRTSRCKLVVYEDEKRPGQLFDLERDPHENHNLLHDSNYEPMLAEMMNEHVLPFLETPPLRSHPSIVQRLTDAR